MNDLVVGKFETTRNPTQKKYKIIKATIKLMMKTTIKLNNCSFGEVFIIFIKSSSEISD